MTHYDIQALNTFWYMIRRSIKVTSGEWIGRSINQMIWCAMNIIVFAYVMPQVGMNQDIGTFIVLTMPASSTYFIAIHCMYGLLFDVTNEGSNLRYELSLPIPQWLVFAKYIFEYTVQAFIAAAPILIMGYALVLGNIPLTFIGLIKYYFILLLTAIFSGSFALFIVSIVKNISTGLDNAWIRLIFPIWFLGCFQFAWKDLYAISPTLAYLDLLNPLTYALEGARSVFVLTDSSLNYWLCATALIMLAILFGYVGIQRLKKRMDCL